MHPLRLIPFLIGAALAACTAHAADDSGFQDSFLRLDQSRWYISDGWANGDYQSCEWWKGAVSTTERGLTLKLGEPAGKTRSVTCPEIHTNERHGYGFYQARMKTAAGAGLNTAFFTYIGPPNGVPEWDEIDFEFLGKDTHAVQINYWTNGKSQLGKSVPLGFDASADFHDYAFDWAPDKIRWYVDRKMVYETPAGASLPHNPGLLFLSLWSGSSVEDSWLGPFHYENPATAEVAWAAYNPVNAALFPQSVKREK
jgi:endo-1,3-1,4-beta-glycanase ExoK